MDFVTWEQIGAECDGYRAGFVKVYRKYQGRDTDEIDQRGRPRKVDQKSFAEHLGVAKSTFRRWVKNVEDGVPLSGRTGTADGPSRRSGQIGRGIAKSPDTPVDDKVGMLSDLMSDPKVVRQWRESRSPSPTPSEAKAAQAFASALVEPIIASATRLQVPMFCDQIDRIIAALGEHEWDESDVRKLGRKARKLVEEITVHEFHFDMEDA